MTEKTVHPSDADLLMAVDGELSKTCTAKILTHLDACWACRARMQTLEQTISSFTRARNQALDSNLPSAAGPRALLRARLEELAAPALANPELANPDPRGAFKVRALASRLAAAVFLTVIGGTLMLFELTVNAEGPRPNSRVTPGETRPITLAEVCSSQQAEVVVRHIAVETQRQVLRTYGIKPDNPGDFEVDYLITPDLGGAETVRNLWPQPYSARWNAKVKDKLEQRLHDLVCAGKLDLPTAQREIAANWIGAYKKYVGPETPR